MPEGSKLKEVLSRIVTELEDEEVREEFEELRQRKPSFSDLLEAIKEAPAEERAQLREILAEEGLPSNGPPPAAPAAPAAVAPAATEPVPAGAPARRKRPGRKGGSAYDWYVDEETGEVTRSPVAVIYSGEDEPDEVEMLDLEPATRAGEE